MNTISVNGIFNLQVIRDGKVISEFSEKNKILPSMQSLLLRQLTSNQPFTIENISFSEELVEYENSDADESNNYDGLNAMPMYPLIDKQITDDGKALFMWEVTGESLIEKLNPAAEEISIKSFALRATVFDDNGAINSINNVDSDNVFDNVPVAQKAVAQSITVTKNDKIVGKWFIDFSLNNLTA